MLARVTGRAVLVDIRRPQEQSRDRKLKVVARLAAHFRFGY
jgi:hypothetical protein